MLGTGVFRSWCFYIPLTNSCIWWSLIFESNTSIRIPIMPNSRLWPLSVRLFYNKHIMWNTKLASCSSASQHHPFVPLAAGGRKVFVDHLSPPAVQKRESWLNVKGKQPGSTRMSQRKSSKNPKTSIPWRFARNHLVKV